MLEIINMSSKYKVGYYGNMYIALIEIKALLFW